MKRNVQILLFVAFCLIAIPAASAQSIKGVYENFSANRQSGDLDGMRVIIVSAGSGYHAIVQIAGGGIDEPEPVLVPVTVKGKTISFTVQEGKYSGRITATRLTLKQEGGGTEILRRKACTTYFR